MKTIRHIILPLMAVLLAGVSCAKNEVPDENVGAWSFTATVGTAVEGEDIPVTLTFKDAGLRVDNASWGDKWRGAAFHGELYDREGRKVENAIFSGPNGVLGEDSVVNLLDGGQINIVIGALRVGEYYLKVRLRSRYAVDSWASAGFSVDVNDKPGTPSPGDEDVLVEDFTVPDENCGLEIDPIGDIILDLKYYNAANPFKYLSTVRPANATNRKLIAASGNPSVAAAFVTGETTIVVVPTAVGQVDVTVRSEDGNAERTFGVLVIESEPDASGFTVPTDDGEKDAFDLDVAGRLALDINEYDSDHPFDYTCKSIPSGAVDLSLMAKSDNEDVLVASIRNGNELRLTPIMPGYATVTFSTTDGAIVRTMKVAVYSKFNVTLDAVEGTVSEEDSKKGIFPCKITIKADSKWVPNRMRFNVYTKATGRIDLADPVDYFKVDSLRNVRTAYYSVEDRTYVAYLSNGNSAYDIYSRVMTKVAAMGAVIHHDADWPNYYDYVLYYRLFRIALDISLIEDFDMNLYRVTINREYDSPKYRIYGYLL